jgi:hypothetical protein
MGERWDEFLRSVMGKERADAHQERKTGKTYIQRRVAEDPSREVAMLDFTRAEMEAQQEGEDPFLVGPQRDRDRTMYDRELGG